MIVMNLRSYRNQAVLVALGLGTFTATAAQAAFTESFEAFEGSSGSTINGFSSSVGTWTGNGTYSIVMTGQTDAYEGENYLRINDQLGAGQVHQVLTLATPEYAGDPVIFSFAFRWAQLETPHQTYPFPSPIFGPRFVDADVDPAAYTEAQGGGNEYKPPLQQWEADGILAQNRWYEFDHIMVVNDDDDLVLSLTITDAETNAVVLDEAGYFTYGLPAGRDSFSGLRIFTGNSSGGIIDVDAITVAAIPEPASLALLGVGALAVGVRRGRCNH